MRTKVFKRILVFAISFAVVGSWWWIITYALHHWKFFIRATVISVSTFIFIVSARFVKAALTNPDSGLVQSVEMGFLKRAGLTALGIAALFEIVEAVQVSSSLVELVLVVIAAVLIFRRLKYSAG